MTKDEMIENMAELMCGKLGVNCNTCFCVSNCSWRSSARNLYNAGYRLINGDDYVSIEWHNEQIAHAEQEIERLRNENEALRNDLINDEGNLANMTALYEETKNSIKQAKIEVLERVKSMMTEREYMGVKYKQGVFSESDIDELIEEVKAE